MMLLILYMLQQHSLPTGRKRVQKYEFVFRTVAVVVNKLKH